MQGRPTVVEDQATRPTATGDVIRRELEYAIRDIGYPRMTHLPAGPFPLSFSTWSELGHASKRMVHLVRRTVLGLGAHRGDRIRALGEQVSSYPLLPEDASFGDSYLDILCRPDIIISDTGLKFIELNVGGGFAGVVEAKCRLDAWRNLGVLSEVVGEGIEIDPLRGRAKYFAELLSELGREPRFAVAGTIRESVRTTYSTRYFDLDVDALRAEGIESDFFDIEAVDDMRSTLSGRAYTSGFFHINPTDVLKLGLTLEGVRRARSSPGTLFLAPQTATLLGNKLVLALLSEGQDWMNADDREFVDAYVPWTRTLRSGTTIKDGRRLDLLDWTLRHREGLVLKRGFGGSADAVLLGTATDQGLWEKEVHFAAGAGNWVVQEVVESAAFSVPVLQGMSNDVETATVRPVFSPFVFGGHHCGVYVRFFTNGKSGIVSVNGTSASDNVAVPI